jgi:uncharacterized protein
MKQHDQILEQIKSCLVLALRPTKIYLMGSRARGDHTPESDYDLVVVVEKSELDGLERNLLARKSLWELDVPVDVFVYTQNEFDQLKGEMSSIPETAVHEGQELSLG